MNGGPYTVKICLFEREGVKMDDCANCEFLEKCREGEKIPCPWETVETVYNPNI